MRRVPPPLLFLDGRVALYGGDCMAVLRDLESNSIAAAVMDPPYGIGFMGKAWDAGDTIALRPDVWRQVRRVLKPGGFLLAFGGTRKYHRLACAIEDAGFEVRDMLAWIFGSGLPKALDLAKAIDAALGVKGVETPIGAAVARMIPGADQAEAGWEKDDGRVYQPHEYQPASAEAVQWDGWATAVKPALEPICMARKPLSEATVAANVLRWGTGALNIDACRIGDGISRQTGGMAHKANPILGEFSNLENVRHETARGRWPAGIVHDGSAEAIEGFPVEKAGKGVSRTFKRTLDYSGLAENGGSFAQKAGARATMIDRDDGGSAARYFYTAKADRDERIGSAHPTVKPLDLMQWLVRLVTPPAGTVLDCFAGTGTTGEAAWREGFSAVLVERDAAHQVDIARRMALCLAGPAERKATIARARETVRPSKPLGGLFAEREEES